MHIKITAYRKKLVYEVVYLTLILGIEAWKTKIDWRWLYWFIIAI